MGRRRQENRKEEEKLRDKKKETKAKKAIKNRNTPYDSRSWKQSLGKNICNS